MGTSVRPTHVTGWGRRACAALGRLASCAGAAASVGVAAVATLAVAGCAVGPPAQPAVERVDEKTAVTVVTLPKPLLYSGARGSLGQPLDLALGPVEINRMGEKRWYLWVALLGADLRDGEPRLWMVSGGERLAELVPMPNEFVPAVSEAPYARPADWATERYYEVTSEQLGALAGRPLVVELVWPSAERWRFEPWGEQEALTAYVQRQVGGRTAVR
jgi:hypothetical protein